MSRTQREREAVNQPLNDEQVKQRAEAGWRMVAVEWERDLPEDQPASQAEVPFGFRLSPQNAVLEVNPDEWQALVLMMEMTVQEGPYWTIAEELNRQGYRTRDGGMWTPISVFQMLPRLIEAGPRIFATEEWRKRRARSRQSGD